MSAPRAVWGDLLRAAAARRGLLASGLAAAAVAAALPALAPGPAPTVTVLAAAKDLAGGAPLEGSDVVPLRLPRSAVPDGALHPGDPVQGRLLALGARRGEPLTDVRLLGPALLASVSRAGGADLVEAPVRLADPGSAVLLRPGDRVDVLAARADGTAQAPAPAGADAGVVAAGAPVLAVPPGDPGADGALVVLAVSPDEAARLAASAVSSRLSVVVLP